MHASHIVSLYCTAEREIDLDEVKDDIPE